MKMVSNEDMMSINSLDELIKSFESIRKKYGNLKLGDDKHWMMFIDILPSGCLIGTEDDGSDALNITIETFF